MPWSLIRSMVFRCLLLLALSLSTGCGTRYPELIPVTGVIQVNGDPLKDATVVFQPEEGWASQGRTGVDGRFRLVYRGRVPGAVPGKHTVRISTQIERDADSDDPVRQQGRPESLPAIYNSASTLTADVVSGQDDDIVFNLDVSKKAR